MNDDKELRRANRNAMNVLDSCFQLDDEPEQTPLKPTVIRVIAHGRNPTMIIKRFHRKESTWYYRDSITFASADRLKAVLKRLTAIATVDMDDFLTIVEFMNLPDYIEANKHYNCRTCDGTGKRYSNRLGVQCHICGGDGVNKLD